MLRLAKQASITSTLTAINNSPRRSVSLRCITAETQRCAAAAAMIHSAVSRNVRFVVRLKPQRTDGVVSVANVGNQHDRKIISFMGFRMQESRRSSSVSAISSSDDVGVLPSPILFCRFNNELRALVKFIKCENLWVNDISPKQLEGIPL